MYVLHILAARRVMVDLSLRRALELVTDNREAAPEQVGSRQSASHVSLESSPGARQEATYARGGSQPEERRGLAADVHMIDRRHKDPVQRVVE
jgi:hypothetical protein